MPLSSQPQTLPVQEGFIDSIDTARALGQDEAPDGFTSSYVLAIRVSDAEPSLPVLALTLTTFESPTAAAAAAESATNRWKSLEGSRIDETEIER